MNHSDRSTAKINWVLLGAGHTHLHVLNRWRMRPVRGVRLTCVTNRSLATYSGMLPGVLAGDYQPEQMHIDLGRRCAAVGARLILAETIGLDRATQKLMLRDRGPLSYDLLSIGIGSVPAEIVGQQHAVSIKPMQTFLERLAQRIAETVERLQTHRSESPFSAATPFRLAIIGGGAGGTEVALCVSTWMQTRLPQVPHELTIVHRGDRLCETLPEAASKKLHAIAEQRGYRLLLGCNAVELDAHGVIVQVLNQAADNSPQSHHQHVAADVVIWAVGAIGPPALQGLDLTKDCRGFLLTDDYLRSIDDPSIFVVGDSGTSTVDPHPKAGVYAVRQGPVLWENLQRSQFGKPLKRWHPQSNFLVLMNTGDRRAVLAYRGFTATGRWCWKLKDHIDRRFVAKHQRYEPVA